MNYLTKWQVESYNKNMYYIWIKYQDKIGSWIWHQVCLLLWQLVAKMRYSPYIIKYQNTQKVKTGNTNLKKNVKNIQVHFIILQKKNFKNCNRWQEKNGLPDQFTPFKLFCYQFLCSLALSYENKSNVSSLVWVLII